MIVMMDPKNTLSDGESVVPSSDLESLENWSPSGERFSGPFW